MLPNITILALASIVAMNADSAPGFSDSDLARWLAVAAFLLVIADRVGALWDRHFKQRPDPRDAFEPKGSGKSIKAEIERDLHRLEDTFKAGLAAIERAINTQREEIKAELKDLEDDFDVRMGAAKDSRSNMHKDIEGLNARVAVVENDCAHLKQKDALSHFKRHD